MTELTDKLTAHYGPPEMWPEKVRRYIHLVEEGFASGHAEPALLELLGENERLRTEAAVARCEFRCDKCVHCKDNHTYIPTIWCLEHSITLYPHDACNRWAIAAHPTEPTKGEKHV